MCHLDQDHPEIEAVDEHEAVPVTGQIYSLVSLPS